MIPNIWSHGTEVCSLTLAEEYYADLLISLICRYPQSIFKIMENLPSFLEVRYQQRIIFWLYKCVKYLVKSCMVIIDVLSS